MLTKYGVRVSAHYLESIGKDASTVRLVDILNDPTMKHHIAGIVQFNHTLYIS